MAYSGWGSVRRDSICRNFDHHTVLDQKVFPEKDLECLTFLLKLTGTKWASLGGRSPQHQRQGAKLNDCSFAVDGAPNDSLFS